MIEEELRSETLKWLERLESEKQHIRTINDKGQEFLVNIEAYISDSQYFLDKEDLVRAFECVVWAWAWLEIGLKIDLFRRVEI